MTFESRKTAFEAAEPLEGAPKPSEQSARFANFFEREWPRLRGYLRRFMGAQDAEDVAQEAFVRVLTAPGNVRSASGLLYQAARNLVIDRERSARRAGPVVAESDEIEAVADPSPSPEEKAHWRKRIAHVSRMLDDMSEKRRQIFIMRVVEELSYAEIAERLDTTSLAVEKHLLKAFEVCARHGERDKEQRRKRAARPA